MKSTHHISFPHFTLSTRFLAALTVASLGLSSLAIAKDAPLATSGDWKLNLGMEYAGATGTVTPGSKTDPLKLAYDFSKGGQYVSADMTLDTPIAMSTLLLTAKGPGGGLTVALTDASGQSLLYRQGAVGASDQVFTINLSNPSTSWGGANDKTVHQPVKSIRIIVEKSASPTGTIEISKITAQSPD
jgi:hypothetical protein